MKEQMSVTELIQTVSQSMKGDGIKQDYITQLSYTWKALEQYLIEYSGPKWTTVRSKSTAIK